MKAVTLKMRVTPQNDAWGCGYCAMACVYRYYGMDPRRLRLRERLGTDRQNLPYLLPFRDKVEALMDRLGLDTRGTLCPDVFAVLAADGFDVIGAPRDYAAWLRRHLRLGRPALALVHGLSHWVVVAGVDAEGVLVLDSSGYADPTGNNRLRYRLKHELFASVHDGMVLVRRRRWAREMAATDYARAYVRGLGFALMCAGRAVPKWLGLAG